jgi:lipopolysaccharide/colanic/teichoic acid biosynthesis glycosyltransferase
MDSPQRKLPAPQPPARPGDISQLGPEETVISVWPLPPRREGGLYLRAGKRIFDTVGALIGLFVTSPVLLLCALAVRLDSRGPVFFRQRRVGQYGRTFQIFKFRTMIHGTDKHGSKLTAFGDARITRVGKILRRTKLDEIPQLINVVRGEMSLVGPRPEVPDYTEKYTPKERRVLEVRPGITGPASLAYIDEELILATAADREKFYVNTIMRRKLRFDLAYCRNVCLLGDARLIIRTGGSLVGLRFSRQREDLRASRASERS